MNSCTYTEIPVIFDCDSASLCGITTVPKNANYSKGILFIVGGPQYRVGVSRQTVLFARHFAKAQIPSFRFDHRGIGDAEGDAQRFDSIDRDISAAIDCFLHQIPTLSSVVLFGLCDSASAALMYAGADRRVTSLILLNPWVHTEETAARTRLKYYYPARISSIDTWREILHAKINWATVARESLGFVRLLISTIGHHGSLDESNHFINRMLDSLTDFQGSILIILGSQSDLTVQEFLTLKRIDRRWQRSCQRDNITLHQIEAADHNFTKALWRRQIGRFTVAWLTQMEISP